MSKRISVRAHTRAAPKSKKASPAPVKAPKAPKVKKARKARKSNNRPGAGAQALLPLKG